MSSCTSCGGTGRRLVSGEYGDYEVNCHSCGGNGQGPLENSNNPWGEKNNSGQSQCRHCGKWTSSPCHSSEAAAWCGNS